MTNKKSASWIDFKLIKEKVSVKDLIRFYRIPLKEKRGGSLIGTCPLHPGSDNPTAFSVSADGRAWHCFTGCNTGGNVLDFVVRKENLDLKQAGKFLTENFLKDPGFIPQSTTAKTNPSLVHDKKPVNAVLDLNLFKISKKDAPFLIETKKLTKTTINKFEIGLAKKGLHAGRIIIPIHNEQGKLVAYAGRIIDEREIKNGIKYYFPPGFHKVAELYNIHRVVANPKFVEKYGIILVEGFFDVIRLWQNGIINAVALMGTSMSIWQKELLLKQTNKIVLMLDKDEAGKKATRKIAADLVTSCFLKIPAFPENKIQPEDLTKEELKNVLS